MNQTVTISSKTIEQILARLDRLTKEVRTIKAKLFEEPPYGSDAWWKWSDKKALEDIKTGRTYGPFENATDLIKSLHKESEQINE